MWVQELTLENIKCFDKLTLKFSGTGKPHKWVTLLGENGVGKSTVLQALGLLLAGPEGANQLLTKPIGWVRNEALPGKISTLIHKSDCDPGEHGTERRRAAFNYTYFITGFQKVTIRNREYSEPSIVQNADKTMGWLRQNAFLPKGTGWFAAGFGAFRRLTRMHQIIVPALQTPVRATAFSSQFQENEPLAVFEQWLVYLDYRIAKDADPLSLQQRDIAINALNRVLPDGIKFDSVNSDGRIFFDVKGDKIATLSLSDGYRSVLALSGELIWRLLMAFPGSQNPLLEEGVVLIDEIDIHLHPAWQRKLPSTLQSLFPNIQFIVTTHSPFIAAGAGKNAITYRLSSGFGKVTAIEVTNLAFLSVEKVLQSPAFELVSSFSSETQAMLDQYLVLKAKPKLTPAETDQLELILPAVRAAMIDPPEKDSLEDRIDKFLEKELNDKGA